MEWEFYILIIYFSIAIITYGYSTTIGDVIIQNELIGTVNYLELIYNFCISKENMENEPQLNHYGSISKKEELDIGSCSN